MVKVLLDVPADSGGAATILNEYYDKIVETNEQWIIILGRYSLPKTENVKVLNFPWVKKSWFHRLFFDYLVLPRLIRKINPELIFSLQNTLVPFVKNRQELYVHQPLPYTSIKFNILSDFKLWTYQNVIKIFINRSAKRANKIFLQTQWMKRELVKQTGIESDKVQIIQPNVQFHSHNTYKYDKGKLKFFYPASPLKYKNHKLIIEAINLLDNKSRSKIEIYFTLSGNENTLSHSLKEIVEEKDLPVFFIGYLDKAEMEAFYESSCLLFPSYVETYGLPLLEAKLKKSPILASDTEFSREILEDYAEKKFFDYNSSQDLASKMKEIIK
ncbi:glycosyltransferase [Atopobacter sp. AH10]|uniref:glycosyltransferase n=1 Tax=Atopobacter sp. AH10 TaxID=2315861 RepID=UPI000EF1EB53|nr:glycosyltransferase [Atopobacter sp. AH10]RLK63790.1 glycosyltransferase [Atopobacter sp. AH10]